MQREGFHSGQEELRIEARREPGEHFQEGQAPQREREEERDE